MKDAQEVSPGRVRWLRRYLILGYAVVVVVAIAFVSLLAIRTTDRVLKNKVSTMATALNTQMQLNMDSYLSRMETVGMLAFGIPDAYTYDATAQGLDAYEALATEKEISDKLYSLCIMENFVDYGIVYRNNHTVGKISNGTMTLFGDRLYTDLSAMVSRQRTRDGWSAGYGDNFKRIYYVKEIHENALLVISFYMTELEDVFDNPEMLRDMRICLTDQDYRILYDSMDAGEVGTPVGADLMNRIQGHEQVTVLDDEYLVTVSGCGDDWYVICSVPTRIILEEKNEMRLYILAAALVAALLAILLGSVISIKLSDAVTQMVTALVNKAHIDQLTGIFNKHSFEEYTRSRLQNAPAAEQHVLILLDVDDFKSVNDTLGHVYGDRVLARIGSALRAVFSSDDYLGRIGGDEFCVFMNTPAPGEGDYRRFVEEKCRALAEAFHGMYTGENGDYKISASIGVAMFPTDGETFEALYAGADKALYASKAAGKDTYTFCEAGAGEADAT